MPRGSTGQDDPPGGQRRYRVTAKKCRGTRRRPGPLFPEKARRHVDGAPALPLPYGLAMWTEHPFVKSTVMSYGPEAALFLKWNFSASLRPSSML